MTYEEALKQLEDSKFKIGDSFHEFGSDNDGYALSHHITHEIIISQPNKWQEVITQIKIMRGDNKKALEFLDLHNDELEVILINNPQNPNIQTLSAHLNI